MKIKNPLYRTKSWGSFCNRYVKANANDENYRYIRNNKVVETDDGYFIEHDRKMKHSPKEGKNLDYTPLYKFLHSKVGCDWDEVYSEAVSRIPCKKPISYIVNNEHFIKQNATCNIGESTSYHTMYVDENNKLAFVNRDAKIECKYHDAFTYSLNGKTLKRNKNGRNK